MTGPSAILADATRRQRQAAGPGQSVWVDASAGTGKTKVLVDRVLSLLLEGAPPEKLLCLTYTRAAAAEMANRINARLAAWATVPEDALRQALADLAGAEPPPDRVTLARRLFARALDAPGGLKIMTIHAFCQSLIARFPLEAGVAPHFELMDERSATEALAAAREKVLAAARADPDGALAHAVGIVAAWAHEDRAHDVLAQLARERGRLRRLLDTVGLDGLVARQRAALGLAADETADAVTRAACEDAAFDRVGLRNCIEALLGGSKTDGERGRIIADWLADPAARAAGFAAYAKAYLTSEGAVRARLATKDIDALFGDTLRREAERVLAVLERCKKIAIAEASAALVRFAAALIDAYQADKADDAALDYDDLVLAARALMARDGGASWVLYKLDGGIDHILIDEAQDTSPAQWAVVAALAEEFFAGQSARDAVRTVFAVGDAKQSIFSFQGADVAAFARMKAHFRDRAEAARRRFQPVELDISFRSTDAVLTAVDAVFAHDAARDGLAVPVRHVPSREGQAGLVELWPVIAREAEDEPDPWTPPVAVRGEDAPDLRLARVIAARIERWIKDGEMLESRARPIRAGDVMVLVSRRTGFVDALVRELKRLAVPVAGIDRMVLADQAAVEDLVALGHFLLLPEDDLTLAEVLKGPLHGFDDDALFRIAYQRKGTLWAALAARAGEDGACAAAHAELSALLARADFTPPFELYAHLLGPAGGRRRILARLGRDARDPLDEFLTLALAYGKTHPPSLQGFLQWLGAGGTEIKRDLEHGRRDEVRILTVHGAKGLQAPIVFLPDTMAGPRPGNAVLWLGEEGSADEVPLWAPRRDAEDGICRAARDAAALASERERHRLLYVAMTRAEDRLYVCGHRGTREAPKGNWYELVAAAMPAIADRVEIDLKALSPAGWTGEGFRLATAQRARPERLGDDRAAAPVPLRDRPDWATGAPPPETTPRPLSPSRPDGEEPPVTPPLAAGDGGASFRRGILIHRLLEALPALAPEARPAAAAAYLARPAHRLDAAARAEIAAEVLTVLADPRFGRVFAPDARAEVAVAGEVAGRLIAGQVDRLAVGPDEVLVVDYKSNRPPPKGAADTPVLYLRQMAAYRAVLTRIWRDRPVRCAILWTAGPALIALPDAMLDPFAPDAAIDRGRGKA